MTDEIHKEQHIHATRSTKLIGISNFTRGVALFLSLTDVSTLSYSNRSFIYQQHLRDSANQRRCSQRITKVFGDTTLPRTPKFHLDEFAILLKWRLEHTRVMHKVKQSTEISLDVSIFTILNVGSFPRVLCSMRVRVCVCVWIPSIMHTRLHLRRATIPYERPWENCSLFLGKSAFPAGETWHVGVLSSW